MVYMKLKLRLVHVFATFSVFIGLASVVPLQSQEANDNASASRQPVTDGADAPLSRQKGIAVMVELNDAPAGKAYADALKVAQAQVDAERNHALAHPKEASSQKLLAKPAVATT